MRPGIESSVICITGAARARSATTSRSPRAGRAESVLEDITFPLAVGSIAPRSDIRDKAPRISGVTRASAFGSSQNENPEREPERAQVLVLVFVCGFRLWFSFVVFVCRFRSGFRLVVEFQP